MTPVPRSAWVMVTLGLLLHGGGRAMAAADTRSPYPGLSRDAFDSLYRQAGAAPPLDTIRTLSALNSVRASEDYSRAARIIADRARDAGLRDVAIERFPSDGRAWYGGFLSEPGWRVREAKVWIGSGIAAPDDRAEPFLDYATTPLGLVWYSRSADLTSVLVNVGEGIRPDDYAGKDVTNRIVLATGSHRLVHQQAVYRHHAAGVLTSWGLFPEEFPDAHSSDGYGIRPWDQNGRPSGFVVAISPRQHADLAARLGRGEHVQARVRIDTEIYPSAYEVVSARVPGSGRLAGRELVLVSHLDSTSPGACHDAAPAALLVEIGRLLTSLRLAGEAPSASAAVRFVWTAEHRGTMAYLLVHPELKANAIGGINLDLLGEKQGLVGSVLQLRHAPDSRPTYIGDVLGELLGRVARDNADDFGQYPKRFRLPLTSPLGTQDPWRVSEDSFEGASDHVELNAIGIPAVSLGSWRYPHLGTTADTVEMFDPTHFRRLAFTVAAAAHTIAMGRDSDRAEMASLVLARAEARIFDRLADVTRQVLRAGRPAIDAEVRSARAAMAAAVLRETEVVRSAWWHDPSQSGRDLTSVAEGGRIATGRLEDAIRGREQAAGQKANAHQTTPPDAGRMPRVTPGWAGPATAEYLAAHVPGADDEARQFFLQHGDAAFEALNFANGERTIEDIASRVNAEFGEMGVRRYVAYFGLLASAGIVELK